MPEVKYVMAVENEIFAPVAETRPATARLLTDAVKCGLHTQLPEDSWRLVSTYFSTDSYIKDLIPIAGTKNDVDIKKRLLNGISELRSNLISSLNQNYPAEELDQMYPNEAVQTKKVVRRKGPHTIQTKLKIAASNTGKVRTEFQRDHISRARKGVSTPHTPEWNLNIRESNLRHFQEHPRPANWGQTVSTIRKRSIEARATRQLIRLQTGESLFLEHGNAIQRYINGMIHDPNIAEELKQEVFIKAFLHYDAGKVTPAGPLPWLLKIAYNETADYIKAMQSRPQISRLYLIDEETGEEINYLDILPDPAPKPEEITAALEQTQTVIDALNDLPTAQGQALYLQYFQDLHQSEISALIQTPLGTVKSRQYRGLDRLRQTLAA